MHACMHTLVRSVVRLSNDDLPNSSMMAQWHNDTIVMYAIRPLLTVLCSLTSHHIMKKQGTVPFKEDPQRLQRCGKLVERDSFVRSFAVLDDLIHSFPFPYCTRTSAKIHDTETTYSTTAHNIDYMVLHVQY